MRAMKVSWQYRMSQEGRTCLVRSTVTEGGGIWGVIEVVRMQEAIAIETMSQDALEKDFPHIMPELLLPEAARQYLVHAANAGASREVVTFLSRLYRPHSGLRTRLDAMLNPPPKAGNANAVES